MQLRPYQQKGQSEILNAWNSGHRNVLYVLPTGGGKTFTFSNIVHKYKKENVVIIAHRETLISQISLSLANLGIFHRILTPDRLIKDISFAHIEDHGNLFIDPLSPVVIGSVDTMARRLEHPEFQKWANNIKLWILDEGHHLLKKNKWGKVIAMFKNANGLGVTATPLRTDGFGLGHDTDGLFNFMIEGPSMRDLIDQGYLAPYTIYCPLSDLDISKVKITANGEFNQKQLNTATMDSKIVGDVVTQYIKYADGLKGLTFCPGVESAKYVTEKYNNAGIHAKLITANSKERRQIIQQLSNGEIKQIVSVDVLGEGMDIPSVEVCSFLRKTESLGLYIQQFGRGMRMAPGKKSIIILDHVGNVMRHNLPDIERKWSLGRSKYKNGSSKNVQQISRCLHCFQPYEKQLSECPYCGAPNFKIKRSDPKQVDGDLMELSQKILDQMRLAIYAVDNPVTPSFHHPDYVRKAILKRQQLKINTQREVRAKISQWFGNHRFLGKTDSEIYKLFYQLTGKDMMEAQTIGGKQATELMGKL